VSAAGDALLFHEPDAKHFITLTRTKDWRYILINSTSKLSSEVRTCMRRLM
jgi:protease II